MRQRLIRPAPVIDIHVRVEELVSVWRQGSFYVVVQWTVTVTSVNIVSRLFLLLSTKRSQ